MQLSHLARGNSNYIHYGMNYVSKVYVYDTEYIVSGYF